MILQKPPVKNKGSYNRTAAQKKPEKWGEEGEAERGYDKSKIDSEQITYSEGSTKI